MGNSHLLIGALQKARAPRHNRRSNCLNAKQNMEKSSHGAGHAKTSQ